MDLNEVVGAAQGAGEKVTGFLERLGTQLKAADFDALLGKAENLRSMGVVSGVLLLLAILFVIRIIRKPMKLVFKLLLNTLLGLVLLFVVNFFGSRYGIGVKITWVNALVTGVFGLPGLAVLMILRFIRVIR